MNPGEDKLTIAASDAMVELDGGYATTIVDAVGMPLGLLYPDGRVVPCAPSQVGVVRRTVDEDHREQEYEVMWDGAKPAPRGRTKGELLGAYNTTGSLWRRMAMGSVGLTRRRRRKPQLDEDGSQGC